MQDFTQEDIKNIIALIAKSPITGEDAIIVAQLQIKLNKLLKPEIKTTSDTTGTTTNNEK